MQPLFLAIAALLAAGMGGSPIKADTQVKPYSYYEGPLDAPKPLTRVEPLPRVEKEVYYTPGTYWTPSYYSQYYYPQVAYVNPAPGTYYYGVQPAAPAVVTTPAVAPVAVAPASSRAGDLCSAGDLCLRRSDSGLLLQCGHLRAEDHAGRLYL